MKKITGLFHRKKLYFQIFGSLCLISMTILVIFSVYTNLVITGEQNQSLARVRALRLQEKMENLEQSMQLLSDSLEQTMWTADFITALINPEDADDGVSQRIVKNLVSQEASNPMIEEIFLVSSLSGKIYHSDNYYMPWEYSNEAKVYENYIENYHPEEHPSNERGNWTVTLWNQKIYLVVDMKTPYYVGSGFLRLEADSLKEMLTARLENCSMYIYDERKIPILGTEVFYGEYPEKIGRVIQADNLPSFALRRSTASAYEIQGKKLPWILVMIPEQTGDHVWIQRLVIILPVFLLLIVFCVFLSWLISRRVYAPIQRIWRAAMKGEDIRTDYSETELFLQQLQTGEKNRERMDNFLKVMSRDILEQIIRKYMLGETTDETYIRTALEEIGAGDLLHGKYVVISGGYRYKNPDQRQVFENTLWNRSFISLVWQMNLEQVTLCPVAFNNTNFVIVCCFAKEVSLSYIHRTVSEIEERIAHTVQNEPFQVLMKASRVSLDIVEIRTLWLDVREKVMYQQYMEGESQKETDREEAINRRYLSESLKQIWKFAGDGNVEEAFEKWDICLKQMVTEDSSVQRKWQELFQDELFDSLLELHLPIEEIQRIEKECGIEEQASGTGSESFFENCKDFGKSVIQLVSVENRKKKYYYVNQAKSYIAEHYAECDLSLTEISAAAGISASYLSALFVEVMGKNFVSFLNEYRVEMAKRLLAVCSLSAMEIGFRCGFQSNQTFYRVFKKYAEMTPNQYREKKKGENVE